MSAEYLASVIRNRRTIKPQQMNGKKIDDAEVQKLIELADWAPTHGHTEPWRFFVFSGDAVKQFCADHANMYRMFTPEEKYMLASEEKLFQQGDLVSHMIVAAMKRGNNPKIPPQEEMASAAASVQNFLLGVHAAGLAAYWGSGGMTYHPAMKEYLQLGEDDHILGILCLGYSDFEKAGTRIVPLSEKVKWYR